MAINIMSTAIIQITPFVLTFEVPNVSGAFGTIKIEDPEKCLIRITLGQAAYRVLRWMAETDMKKLFLRLGTSFKTFFQRDSFCHPQRKPTHAENELGLEVEEFHGFSQRYEQGEYGGFVETFNCGFKVPGSVIKARVYFARYTDSEDDTGEDLHVCDSLALGTNALLKLIAARIEALKSYSLSLLAGSLMSETQLFMGDTCLVASSSGESNHGSVSSESLCDWNEDDGKSLQEQSVGPDQYRIERDAQSGFVRVVCTPQNLVLHALIGSQSDPVSHYFPMVTLGVRDESTGIMYPSQPIVGLCERLRKKIDLENH